MGVGLLLAIAGAALVAGVSGAGSALGISISGQASSGLLSEEPEKFGNVLILTALPGTQGFYGFVTGIMVLIKTGLLTGSPQTIKETTGLAIFATCLFSALVQFLSAIYQGKVCAAAISGIAAKQEGHIMKGVTLAVLVETYAVLGLLTALIILLFAIY
jgi:V/A-type H+-transporting ATPase subunit K